jgi:hypothetical protein
LDSTPTWCANCEIVRSRQATGVLTLWFSCSARWNLRTCLGELHAAPDPQK